MDTVQPNPLRFNYSPNTPPPRTPPAPRTLDDLRVVHDNYDTAGSFSAKSMGPIVIAALVIAAGAGIVYGVNMYSENNAAKISAAASGPNATPATPAAPAAAVVATAKDSSAAEPIGPTTKSVETSPAPLAGPANNQGSEAVNPPKAKATAKTAAAPARKAAPVRSIPADEITSFPQEPAPAAVAPPPAITPAPAIIEPLPAPAPAPIVAPPVEPKPQ